MSGPHPAAWNRPTRCIHLGGVIDVRTCNLCGLRNRKYAVRACAVHGECSQSTRHPRLAACFTCDEYKGPKPRDNPPMQSLRKWRSKPWHRSAYRGRPIIQTPVDLWLTSELIDEVRPQTIVELGTKHGGHAVWLADQQRVRGIAPRVITVDRRVPSGLDHPGIRTIQGDTLDAATVAQARELTREHSPTLWFFDDCHRPDHVAAELDLWSPLSVPGDWLIVCDTVAVPRLLATVRDWVRRHPQFEAVPLDRFGLSNHRNGWLRRT